MWEDTRHAWRSFSRKPLVVAVAVLTLGLGIGGTTVVFSVVDGVLLRALPFPEADRLVRVWQLTPDGDRFSVSETAFLELASLQRALQPVAAYRDGDPHVLLADGAPPRRIRAVAVSASLPDVLGIAPQLGRTFTREEDKPGPQQRPLLLSHDLWRSRYAESSNVIGQVVTLDGQPYRVTGVMPPRFNFPDNADAWVPLAANEGADHSDKTLAVIARLGPGATLDQAAAELREMAQRWSRQNPEANGGWSAAAVPFSEWLISPRYRDAVWVLFAAVALLLLLACANVANLLLAQAVSREGEMRMRTALGAPRARLVRQLVTESAALAVIATAAGILIAVWAIEGVRTLGTGAIPRLESVSLNGTVLLFGCVAGALSCLAFGLAPALYASHVDLRSSLDQGVRHTARSTGLRQTLVVAEVALALLLLVMAGLLGNSFVRLLSVDPGFDVASTLAMPIEHTAAGYSDERIADFYRDLLDRLGRLPGVVAAGATTTNPWRQGGYSNSVTPIERAATAPPSGLLQAGWRSVTPAFFDAMGIPVLAGRVFNESDHANAERVVVVSESLARRLWPGESPIGKRIYWGGTSGSTRTVVGVSGDIRDVRLDADPAPILFVPHQQVDVPQLTVVMRTREPLERMAPLIRDALAEFGADAPAPPIYPLSGSRSEIMTGPRFNTSLLAAFAIVGFVLAITGVYGMLAFSVSERRREIAVRMALGASSGDVARLVLRKGLRLAGLGIACGLAAVLAAGRLVSSLLYEVAPTDVVTLATATAVLFVAAILATLLPARAAATVDAAALLNQEV
jgi:predicted permease